jgi:hypothetical protein
VVIMIAGQPNSNVDSVSFSADSPSTTESNGLTPNVGMVEHWNRGGKHSRVLLFHLLVQNLYDQH